MNPGSGARRSPILFSVLDSPVPLIEALSCPDDGGSLAAGDSETLHCAACGRIFPLWDGIPSLLPLGDERSEHEIREVAAERQQRDREAARYDRLLGLRLFSLVEVPATLRPLCVRPGDRVVEAGCGTGRFTVRLARSGAEVVAVDHSLESLRMLRGKLRSVPRARVQLVHGDAARLPVRDAWAAGALSCQVLEHLPSEALRVRAIAELARVLAPDGRFALSAYRHAPWLPREGHHSGRIFFHRFERAELRRLLAPEFEVRGLTGRLVYVLLTYGQRRRVVTATDGPRDCRPRLPRTT